MNGTFRGSPFLDEAAPGAPAGGAPWRPGLDRLVAASAFAQFDVEPQGEDTLQALHDDECAACCGSPVRELEGLLFEDELDDERDSDDEAPLAVDEEAWSGRPEQIAFRDAVLAEHIERSRRRLGAAQPDLASTALDTIAGTQVRTARATAAAAGRLLAAARADLAAAQRAGDADALRTIDVTATSGYRSAQYQRELWLQYFGAPGGYYDQTRAAREALAEGPHSRAAVDYMLRRSGDGGFGLGGRIAAPGYSNHQNGIAIDWLQRRRAGHRIRNKSSAQHRRRWRDSWFHRWLLEHATRDHGFSPIDTEEWHWEYRGAGAARAPAPSQAPAPTPAVVSRPSAGGRLWAFEARAWATRVAIYCPAAAASGPVTLLFYVHGHLAPCGTPRLVPEGLITDPPFAFDRLIADSKQPVVLIVPHMKWATPGGSAVWGAEHARWHALARPATLNALLAEAVQELARERGGKAPTIERLIVAGHSRAYDFLEPLAHSRGELALREGVLARLAQVWAFDTTYAGQVDRWTAWLAADNRLRVTMFYRPHGDTRAVGNRFYAARGGRLDVQRVEEGHCAVPARRLPALLQRLGAGADHEIDDETEALPMLELDDLEALALDDETLDEAQHDEMLDEADPDGEAIDPDEP